MAQYKVKDADILDGTAKFIIYNLYKVLNIMDDIHVRRLGWEGRIIRMEDERNPPKKGS